MSSSREILIPMYPWRYSLHENSVFVILVQWCKPHKYLEVTFRLEYSAAQMESSCFAVVKAKEKNSFDCSGITCLDINWILCKALVEIWRCILSCGKQIYAVIRNIRRVEHTLIFNIFSPNHLWSPRRHWRDLQRLLNPLSLKMQSTQGNNKSPFILKMVFFSCSAPEITGP